MSKLKIFAYILAVLFGVFMVIYGEKDDSPGGQFLGLVVFIAGIFGLLKSRKRVLSEK